MATGLPRLTTGRALNEVDRSLFTKQQNPQRL
jgi:hypothetical protein